MSDLYNVADSIYILAYRGRLEFSEFYIVSNLWLDFIINRTDKDITLCLLSFQNINQIHKVIQTSKSFSCNSRIFLGLQPKSIFYLQLPFFCSCFQLRKQLYIHKWTKGTKGGQKCEVFWTTQESEVLLWWDFAWWEAFWGTLRKCWVWDRL